MSQEDDFGTLLLRVRHGDAEAARHLVNRFESAVRVAVRTRLSDPRLRRQFDSMDVCQSVLASFFIHVAAGAYDLHDPPQLLALLTKMAQNKLGMRVRRQYRQCRDARRISPMTVEEMEVVSTSPGPAREAAGRDLLERVLSSMSPEIRELAQRRMRGDSWGEIALATGGTADGRRKQFERAVSLVVDTLDDDSLRA